MTINLTIPVEGPYSDIERDWIDNEPPGLFPEDQNSYWGQVRKVFSDYLQTQADLMATWWTNLDPRAVGLDDIPEWEYELGIPYAAAGRTLAQRRLFVLSRYQQGAFTRTRRRNVVESFITATFGDSIIFDSFGVAFTVGGIPFFSGAFSLVGAYNIVEDIPGFFYHVRVKDSLGIDLAGLTRELLHITPGGIGFDIPLVHDPFGKTTLSPLTLAGNEITDAKRTAALAWLTSTAAGQTDGVTPPGGIFVGRAATNRFPHGQVDTTGNWGTAGASGVVRSIDATQHAPYGPQMMKYVCDGAVINQGVYAQGLAGEAAVPGTLAIGSIRAKLIAGQSYIAKNVWQHTDATTVAGATMTFLGTGAPDQLIAPPAPAVVGAGKTGDLMVIYVATNGPARAETVWYAHPMLEKGQAVVAPYVPTTAGAQTVKAAGQMQMPASLTDETRGFIAIKAVAGWDANSGSAPVASTKLFEWFDDANNRIYGYLDNTAGSRLTLVRSAAGVSVSAFTPAQTFHTGDPLNFILAWEAGLVKVSTGGAFVSVAGANIPALAAALLDLGRGNAGTQHFDSPLKAIVVGIGPVTDANANTFASLPSNGMLFGFADLPSSMLATAIMPMVDTTYYEPLP